LFFLKRFNSRFLGFASLTGWGFRFEPVVIVEAELVPAGDVTMLVAADSVLLPDSARRRFTAPPILLASEALSLAFSPNLAGSG
jgi:hypothetical protein